jgi:sulfite exporter TauE/SafE/copper chaperone CopZ
MSRRRSRAHRQAPNQAPTAVPAVHDPAARRTLQQAPATSAPFRPDPEPEPELGEAELRHQRAIAIREYRMGRAPIPAGFEDAQPATTSDGLMSVTYPVVGMTCRSCEVRISKFVSRLPNVERVTASAVRGRVTVESSAPVSPLAIERAINKAGYVIGRTPWFERDPKVWLTAGFGVLIVAAVALVASATGVANLASGAGDLSQGGLVVALLLGLAAGVSTCMALVGGLVLGLSAAFAASRTEPASPAAQLRPGVVFVAGRVVGYAVFGAALGALGASVVMPPQLTATLMIAVAIVMTILGTRLTGLSPRIAGWSPTLPLGLGARLGLSGGAEGGVYSDTRAAALGALSFFLPCGFTQAIQIYALSTGSPAFAAALLGVFALGTAPGLLAVAGLPVVVPARAKPTLLRVVGVVVIGFALLNGTAGLRLFGFTLPTVVGAANAAADGALGADGVQRLTTYQDGNGYRPGNVVIYAGYPTEWTIQSSDTATCAASLFAPGLDIRAQLHKGANTFSLPALPPGVVDYTCAMGMYTGRITVVAKPAAPVASAAGEADVTGTVR